MLFGVSGVGVITFLLLKFSDIKITPSIISLSTPPFSHGGCDGWKLAP